MWNIVSLIKEPYRLGRNLYNSFYTLEVKYATLSMSEFRELVKYDETA